LPFGSIQSGCWTRNASWISCRVWRSHDKKRSIFRKIRPDCTRRRDKLQSPSDKQKYKDYGDEKINADPYTKRTAGRVAATPALQNKPVGLASCTTQAHARRPLEYLAGAYGTHARTPFPPSTSSDTSRAALKSFTEANCHVSSNPHVYRTPATDSRRPADPTSRVGPAKWRVSHVRFVRGVPHGNAPPFETNGIRRIDRSSSSRTGTGSDWLKTH